MGQVDERAEIVLAFCGITTLVSIPEIILVGNPATMNKYICSYSQQYFYHSSFLRKKLRMKQKMERTPIPMYFRIDIGKMIIFKEQFTYSMQS